MRKNHSKIVCIKLVHLPYLYIWCTVTLTSYFIWVISGINWDMYIKFDTSDYIFFPQLFVTLLWHEARTLLDFCNFRLRSLRLTQYKTFAVFAERKIRGIIHLERRAEFFLGEMPAQWDVCGGRIVLGDNTRGRAIMRGRSGSSLLEFGYPLDSLLYTYIV